uniref:Reverse transcriptase Ty1/copia-type domain-containing protein n=1 Tax=Fagus sylvatica TaxID=28930 RepID=A0A2N9H044_FAGSY
MSLMISFLPHIQLILAAITSNDEPTSFSQAVKNPQWREAMANEIAALEANNTWTLETLPPGKCPIPSKWVYKIKYKPDGTIERHKARLVAKGYTQVEGLDYHETFAHVAKLITVCCLLVVAAIRNWELHPLDVNNTFLHGDLHEEVYMTIPQGTSCVAILIYVDDVISADNDSHRIFSLKNYLHSQFRIKDLGPLKYFLGIEVARSSTGIVLSQRKYTLDILTESGMLGACPCSFPMEQQHKLSTDSGPSLPDPAQYRRLGLLLPSTSSLQVRAYCDSDWASCPMTRRSTTGYFTLLGDFPISWKSKKQTIVSHSSAKAEYRAMSAVTSELIWLHGLLRELLVSHPQPMQLFCDNQAALHIAANPVYHERTKHIEIDCHFIRERIQSKEIVTAHVSSHDQLADIFTKALGRDRFLSLSSKLGIANLHAPT